MTNPSSLEKRSLTFIIVCEEPCEHMCDHARMNDTCKEWGDKGVSNHDELVPIEGGERVQSQTGHAASNRGELDVLRSDPSNPIEVRHCLGDVIGEPEIDEHGGEAIHEPSHPGNHPAVGCIVGLGVEGTIEGNDGQVGGPDSLGRVDEESTRQAGEAVPNIIGRKGHEY